MSKKLAPILALLPLLATGCTEEGTRLSADPKKCEQQLTKSASPQWLADTWDIDPSRSIDIAAQIFYLCRDEAGKYEYAEDARDRVGVRLSE